MPFIIEPTPAIVHAARRAGHVHTLIRGVTRAGGAATADARMVTAMLRRNFRAEIVTRLNSHQNFVVNEKAALDQHQAGRSSSRGPRVVELICRIAPS